jgi:hypothetical protein
MDEIEIKHIFKIEDSRLLCVIDESQGFKFRTKVFFGDENRLTELPIIGAIMVLRDGGTNIISLPIGELTIPSGFSELQLSLVDKGQNKKIEQLEPEDYEIISEGQEIILNLRELKNSQENH